jgi:hypothetical protein
MSGRIAWSQVRDGFSWSGQTVASRPLQARLLRARQPLPSVRLAPVGSSSQPAPARIPRRAIPEPAARTGTLLHFRSRPRLQNVDDQKNHQAEDNDKDGDDLPKRLPTIALILELSPVPRIGVMRLGRDWAYRRWHRTSVGRPFCQPGALGRSLRAQGGLTTLAPSPVGEP